MDKKIITLKCRFCDFKKEVIEGSQKTFICPTCDKKQRVGKLTIIDGMKVYPKGIIEHYNQPKADTDGNKEIIKESVEIPEKNNEVEAKQEERTPLGQVENASPESSEIAKSNKEVQNAPSNSSQEAHTLEIEQEDEENPAESYNHQCGACGTYFNEFKEENGRSLCPHCGEDWTDFL